MGESSLCKIEIARKRSQRFQEYLLYLRWKASVVCFSGRGGRVISDRCVKNEPDTSYQTTQKEVKENQESKKHKIEKKKRSKINPTIYTEDFVPIVAAQTSRGVFGCVIVVVVSVSKSLACRVRCNRNSGVVFAGKAMIKERSSIEI